jgi:hypothetical protein
MFLVSVGIRDCGGDFRGPTIGGVVQGVDLRETEFNLGNHMSHFVKVAELKVRAFQVRKIRGKLREGKFLNERINRRKPRYIDRHSHKLVSERFE